MLPGIAESSWLLAELEQNDESISLILPNQLWGKLPSSSGLIRVNFGMIFVCGHQPKDFNQQKIKALYAYFLIGSFGVYCINHVLVTSAPSGILFNPGHLLDLPVLVGGFNAIVLPLIVFVWYRVSILLFCIC
jgi:hypothetical protein